MDSVLDRAVYINTNQNKIVIEQNGKPSEASPAEEITSIGGRIAGRSTSRSEYTARVTKDPEDIRRAQALRFMVFNLELKEGLAESYATGLDRDPFDDICDHLIVEDKRTGNIVGTYRIQTGTRAKENLGYYSAQEFDLSPFEPVRNETIELGRACVHIEHRNLTVLSFLWRGIHTYAINNNAKYLFGCSSLTSQDPAVGARAYADLCPKFLPDPRFYVKPQPQCACPLDVVAPQPVKIPKLLSAYLAIGTKICGAPVIDRQFKTIDFLILLDLNNIPDQVLRKYMAPLEG